jgi:tRNA(Glu) U13 pseudouridine synthase TruD
VQAFELSATGPMPGVEMLAPLGEVLQLEQAATHEVAGPDLDWAALRRFGEGTRRPLRLRVRELTWQWLDAGSPTLSSTDDAGSRGATRDRQLPSELPSGEKVLLDLDVQFALPKGAYATTVLGAVFQLQNAQYAPQSSDADHTATREESESGTDAQ